MTRHASLIGLLLLCLCACATSKRQVNPGDTDGGAADDGDAAVVASGAVGSACKRDSDCPDGLFCDEEIPNDVPVSGAPGGEIKLPLFLGGSCTPRSLAPYDPEGGTSCDVAASPGAQGCGKDGACVVESSDPDVLVSCRAACEPSATTSGCEREGYTCDFRAHACLEGCGSDAECKVLRLDSDGDGQADTLAYDDSSTAFCDENTFRCSHTGGAAAAGVACNNANDCEADGLCITEASTLAGLSFPGGFCTKTGCEVVGRECGGGTVCASLRPLSAAAASAPVCLSSCRVGAEPKAQQLGAAGHGQGCRDGYRCHYNGGTGEADGVCVGGVYNDVKKNNIGSECETDGDCFSPFGYGRCLFLQVGDVVSAGTCSIVDCNAPGLPDGVCGTGNACIGLHDDVTFCVHECKSASDCPTGAACADEDADPLTPSICYPACIEDAECRDGETCEMTPAGAGQCTAE